MTHCALKEGRVELFRKVGKFWREKYQSMKAGTGSQVCSTVSVRRGFELKPQSNMNLHSFKSAYIFSKTLEHIRTKTGMAQVKKEN